MTTHPQYTLKSQDVYPCTSNTLDTLPLHMPGAIASRDLLRVLVFAAASRLSVQPACDQLERAPSGPTVLGTRASQCRDLAALAGQLHDLWATRIPQGLGHRGRRGAVDGVALPSHGTGDEAHQDAVCRHKAQGGPPHFFPDATASAIGRGRRDPLAMCRVRAKPTMDEVCRPLLARLGTWGIRSKRVWLDRGFSRGQGIPDLLSGEWPFIRPAVQRGQQPPTAGGPTGTSALAATPQGPWPPSTLQSAQDAHVDCDLAVVCHNTRGQRGRHQREALL